MKPKTPPAKHSRRSTWFAFAACGLVLAAAPATAENAVLLEGFETGLGAVTIQNARANISRYTQTGADDINVTEGTHSLQVQITSKGWGQDVGITFSDENSAKIRAAALSPDVARYVLRWDYVFPLTGATYWMSSQSFISGVSWFNDLLDSNNGKQTMSIALDLIGSDLPSTGPITIGIAQNFDAPDPFTSLTIYIDNIRLVDTYAPNATAVVYPLQSFEDSNNPIGGAQDFAGGSQRTTYSQYTAQGPDDPRVSAGTHSLRVDYSGAGAYGSDFTIPFNNTKLAEVLRLDLPVGQRPNPAELARYTLRFEVVYPPGDDWMACSFNTLASAFPYSQNGTPAPAGTLGFRKAYSITLDQTTWADWTTPKPSLLFIANGAWGPSGTTIYYDNFRLIDTGATDSQTLPTVVKVTADTTSDVLLSFSKPVSDTALASSNYSIDQGVTVSMVGRAGLASVKLNTSRMAEGHVYTLTINNVEDTIIPPNTIPANTAVQFQSFVFAPGLVVHQKYNGFSDADGSDPARLFADPRFPTTPDRREFLSAWEYPANGGYRDLAVDPARDYFDTIEGYFVPPTSGSYVFFTCGGDRWWLYLSTDESPANKHLVAAEPGGWTDPRGWNHVRGDAEATDLRSDLSSYNQWPTAPTITLEAGKRYYLLQVHYDPSWAGADDFAVTYKLAGDPDPIDGDAPKLTGSVVGAYLDPTVGQATFADVKLETAVRHALNRPDGPLYSSELQRLTVLDVSNLGIMSLDGLQAAVNLRFLSAAQNQITSLAPLAGLSNLTSLYLWSNPIADLSPLSGLHNLDTLSLNGATTADLSVISTLSSLQRLELFWMNFRDLSLLQNLPNLRRLKLDGNGITDISLLGSLSNLEFLDLSSNQIHDLFPLAGLSHLNAVLLNQNRIADLSPLSGLGSLDLLELNGNDLRDLSPLTGILINNLQLVSNPNANFSVLGSLHGLHHLNLAGNQLSDISFLANQSGLIGLALGNNWISDISALNELTAPGWVGLDGNFLDLSAGGSAAATINSLRSGGAIVTDTPQNPLPPGLAFLGTQSLFAGERGPIIPFTAGDPSRAAEIVSVAASSSDQSAIANGDISVGGLGLVRTLQLWSGIGAAREAVVTIIVTYQDGSTANGGLPVTILPSGPGSFFIEAEDFNFGGGQHQSAADAMPYLGNSYSGLSAVQGIDYFGFSSDDPNAGLYRLGEDPNVGVAGSGDANRGASSLSTDYRVAWNSAGDWFNYTRNFPAGRYNVYARLSSGAAAEHARLDLVTSGATTLDQSLVKLGDFDAPATGNWGAFGFVPLKTDSGQLAAVSLGGTETLRFTVLPGNLDFNYLALVPAATPSGPAPALAAVFAFNGNQVWATFDQMLDPATASDPSLYSVAGANVTSATLSMDARTVLLTVSGFSGSSVTLTVNGILGASGMMTATEISLAGAVSPFQAVDIGTLGDPVEPGRSQPVGDNGFDVTAGGTDIWGNADHFHFVYESWTGDFDMQVQVTQLAAAQNYAKAALMMRQNLTPGSPNIKEDVTPSSGANRYEAQFRSVPNGLTANWPSVNSGPSLFPNAWLRLKRQGSLLSAYRSTDGANWQPMGQFLQTFSDPVFIGLATTSHVNAPGQVAQASYRNWSISTPPPLYSVETLDALASEAGADSGLFRISLSGDHSQAITVHYTLGGTAQNGIDYEAIPTAMTIPAGQTSVVVPIRPLPNAIADGYRNVILTLAAMDGVEMGNTTATVGLFDDHPIPGFLKREIYRAISGTAVADLTGAPRFPDQPSQADVISSLESTGLGLNYGERLSGYLIPPTTGDYVFYLAADDQAELWLSTDETPARMVMIASEPQWNNPRDWTGTLRRNPDAPENRSSPIWLVASQSYYVEVLHKQAGGGEQVAVTWQKPGDSVPMNGSDPIPGTCMALRVPLAIAALTPAAVQSGGDNFTLTVSGSGFAVGSTVLWNASGRSTRFVSPTQLQAQILGTDIASSSQISTATVTVQNSGGEVSNPALFAIGSATVALVDSTVAPPGGSVVVSTAPSGASGAGDAGVSATFNNADLTSSVAVTAATYSTNPNAGTLFDTGAGFVDLQVTGAHPTDSMSANFYYPSSITLGTEASLVLLYYDTEAWVPVRSSGNADPAKDPTDNLDGTMSGGRFTVLFDGSSTPKVTELNGTVFASTTAAVAEDRIPPVPDASLQELRAQCAVTIPKPPTATDAVTGKTIGVTRDPLTYTTPGSFTVHWFYNDGDGNMSAQTQTVVVEPMGFNGFLAPIAGADAQGGSSAKPIRTFRLGSTIPVKFTASCNGTPVTAGTHTLQVLDSNGARVAGGAVNNFRLSDGQWIFNLNTNVQGLAEGSYGLRATLSDGSTHLVWIKLE